MLGRRILVAPALEENCETRPVRLPEGDWIGFFDGHPYEGGRWITAGCSLAGPPEGMTPVFLRAGANHPLGQ
jgi:alpha-glucosidase (family GH31 glycosyl hydrolase)